MFRPLESALRSGLHLSELILYGESAFRGGLHARKFRPCQSKIIKEHISLYVSARTRSCQDIFLQNHIFFRKNDIFTFKSAFASGSHPSRARIHSSWGDFWGDFPVRTLGENQHCISKFEVIFEVLSRFAQ